MFIPRFWARERGSAQAPDGRTLPLTVWGWSAENLDAARRAARDRLAEVAGRLRSGDPPGGPYAYGTRPLREEILEDRSGADDEGGWVLTRNAYGSVILNTPRVLFIDVDVPASSVLGLVGRLFRRKPDPAAEAIDRLRAALGATGRSFNVYRTAAGVRALCVDRAFEPGAGETQALMAAAGADPAFVRLCRVQQSFRARLSPKPWRCGVRRRPPAYPRETTGDETALVSWVRDYDRATAGFATCRRLEPVGSARASAALAPLVELHDRRTRCGEDLPLA